MADQELAEMIEIAHGMQLSVSTISDLQKLKSPHLDQIIGTLEKHEQKWRDLLALQRKLVDKCKSDRETTKAARDKALADQKEAVNLRQDAEKIRQQAEIQKVSL